jgi:hypothetical protein
VRRSLAFPLAALSLGAAGCVFGPRVAVADARPLTVVLFDVSPSTHSEEIRARYRNGFARVVDAMAADGGILLADVIDAKPLTHSTFPVRAEFEEFSGASHNPLTFREEVDQKKRDARQAAAAILEERPEEGGTAILDALDVAARALGPHDGPKYLVLFSDMIEVSDRYTFRGDGLDPASVEAFIEVERATGRLPDLAGVHVYVVGAGADTSDRIDGARFLAMRDFWLAYFEAAGARLPMERYGAAFLEFP